MTNAIRMDLYRMFRTKSLYVIWLILVVFVLLTTSIIKVTADDAKLQELSEMSSEYATDTELGNIGMSVSVPTQAGEKITLLDLAYGNIQAKALGLFLVIFTILFSTADVTSGFIKHIGSHTRQKSIVIFSKAVCLFVHTVLTFGIYLLVQAMADRIFLGYFRLGDADAFFKYISVQLLLNYALVMICMAIAITTRSNLLSMIVAICLCMNIGSALYGGISTLLDKAGIKDLSIVEHTVTGKIAYLPMNPAKSDITGSIAVAAVFLVAAFVLECIVTEKRDIV